MRLGVFRQRPNLSFFRRSGALGHRCFTGSAQAGACEGKTSSGNGQDSRVTGEKNASSSCTKATASPGPAGSMLGLAFWSCRSTWKRAGINTFRCLVGCTSGDFSALWMLQSYYPEMAVNTSMALSSKFPIKPSCFVLQRHSGRKNNLTSSFLLFSFSREKKRPDFFAPYKLFGPDLRGSPIRDPRRVLQKKQPWVSPLALRVLNKYTFTDSFVRSEPWGRK